VTVIATALKHMLAAGMSAEAIVDAVAEMEAALPLAQPVEPRRSKGAERQARYRERHKSSQTVTGDADNVTCDEKRNGTPLPLSPKDNNSNPHTPTRVNSPRAKAEAHVAAWWGWRVKHPFPRPHWATDELWADFLTNRKRKDLPSTKAAHDKLLRDVAALAARSGWPPGEIFRACVEKNWGAIYETDEMKAAINANGNGGNQRSTQRRSAGGRDNRDGLARALDEQIERARGGAPGRSGAGEGRGDSQRALAAPAALP
jgi:hypothetical protein